MTRWAHIAFVLAILGALGTVAPANAVQPGEALADGALEARARTLSRELRCMVCQNESIDESNAPLARDLRLLVRERLVAGDSDGQVIDFLVARYGEFVLLRPRFSTQTVVLWASPVVVLAAGAVFLILRSRRRRTDTATTAPLSPAEEASLRTILEREAPPPITKM